MKTAQISVMVPAASAALSDGLAKLTKAIIENHRAGGGVAVELSKDVMDAVKNLAGPLQTVSEIDDEAKEAPVGVAQAFALAGFEVASFLLEKPPVA